MIFGISATDIWHAIQLCEWIHKNYIHRDRPGSSQYDRFVSLIQSFSQSLEDLRHALDDAAEPLASPTVGSGHDDLRRNSEAAIGDFKQTLQQCCVLLIKHGQIRAGSTPGFWDQARWVLAQSDVNTLTQRLTVHTQQILFILGPINLQMTMDARDAMFEMLHTGREQDVAGNPRQWPEVPRWMADVFSQNLQGEDAPFTFTSYQRIPLHFCCSALHSHVLNSTYQIRHLDDESQTIDHYVNLIKAQWLVSVLREADALEQLRPASVFPRFISHMRYLVFKEFGRYGLVRPSDGALQDRLEESPASFAIWPPAPSRRPTRRPTDPEADEERMDVTAPLSILDDSGVQGSLLCFRKKDDHRKLRLVPVAGPDGHPEYQPFRMNTSRDRFVPVYATDYERGPKRVKIFHANDVGSDEFIFTSISGAWDFQRAVTGYQVVGDVTSAKWTGHPSKRETVSSFGMDLGKAIGVGRVQVWHWNPWKGVTTEAPDNASHVATDNSSSTTRTDSSGASNKASMLSGATTMVDTASVIAAKQGAGRAMVRVVHGTDGNAEALALKPPIPPVLICFQKDEQIFSMFRIQMAGDVFVNTSACECTKHPDRCPTLILESSEKTFPLSILSTPSTSPGDWNLSVFGRSITSPSISSPKAVREMKCKHLTLVFSSAAERIYISDTIKEAKRRFDIEERELAYVEKTAERIAGGAVARREEYTPASSRRASMMTAASGGGEERAFLRVPSPVSVIMGPWNDKSEDG